MPTLDEFLAAQATTLTKIRALPLVTEIVVPFVALYERGVELIPGGAGEFHAHLYLMCFRSYLSAVSQILRLMPDDSAAVTRRAVEMARVAMAVKYKPANYMTWWPTRNASPGGTREASRRPPALYH